MTRAAFLVSVLILLLAMPLANAHVTRDVGPYKIKVGWDREPAATQERNAITMQVWKTATGEGVSALSNKLTTTVSLGTQSKQLNMDESDEAPGNYSAPIFLTEAGIYRVHVEGSFGGVQVSQDFQIEEAKDIGEDAFPPVKGGVTNADLQQEIQQMRTDIENLKTQNQNKGVPGVGLVGLVGVVGVSALVLTMARRRSP